MIMAHATTGQRIAVYRRRRGLSQAALSALVGRSESWLSQVERGIRSVDRMSVLLDMARILHVDGESLTGRPWQYAPNGGALVDGLDQIRRVLARYAHISDAIDSYTLVEPSDLRARSAQAHQDYQAADYSAVISDMPEILVAADQLYSDPGSEGRESSLAYVSAYVIAAKLLTKLGSADLAAVAADRAAMKAGATDSLTAQGVSIYQVVCALLRADRTDEAEGLAVRMVERMAPQARSDEPSLLSVAGSLWLIAAVTAAQRTDRTQAWRRLDEAERLAQLLGTDGNHMWTAFGPTNVAIHRVSVAAELGDPAEALRAAGNVQLDNLPAGLHSRRAQMNLDLAWAQAQRKRDAEATLHLLEAERAAPEAIRYNVMVRETIREMLSRQRRRPTSTLNDLAARAGALE
jgi:transcriptional regulator with XRE-family HTH domain